MEESAVMTTLADNKDKLPHGPNGGVHHHHKKEDSDVAPRNVPSPQSDAILTNAGLSSIAKIVGIVAIIVVPLIGFIESRIEIANQGATIKEMRPKLDELTANAPRYELMVQLYEVDSRNVEVLVAYTNDLRLRMQAARIGVPDAPKLEPRPLLPPPYHRQQ